MVVLQRLSNRGLTYITPDLVLPHTLGNLTDSFFSERTRLVEMDPAILHVLDALAHFRSCKLQPDSSLVLKFAENIRNQTQPHSWLCF
jgi:hypothetical protein